MMLGIVSVLVNQISVLESYLVFICFKISYDKNVKIVIIYAFKSKFYQYFVFPKKYSTNLSHFAPVSSLRIAYL